MTDEEHDRAREAARNLELEELIGAALARRDAAVIGSPQHRMAIRQLIGLSHSESGLEILEDLDPEHVTTYFRVHR